MLIFCLMRCYPGKQIVLNGIRNVHNATGVGNAVQNVSLHNIFYPAGFSLDDWVWASVTLYLDIINLFLYLLQIIGRSQRN